jgi:hypothetical protein
MHLKSQTTFEVHFIFVRIFSVLSKTIYTKKNGHCEGIYARGDPKRYRIHPGDRHTGRRTDLR